MSVRPVRLIENPPLPLARRYGLMSEAVVIQTNDPAVLAAADTSFGRFELPEPALEPLVLRVFRGPPAGTASADPEGRRIHYRIDRHHFVFGGSSDLVTTDARAGVASVFVSDETAADVRLLRSPFLEGPALAMLMYARGYLAVHAAGVSRDGAGVALVGGPGAGKSTLAVAAARRGLGVFAEDGVFFRVGPAGLEFWGVPWTHRLLRDARRFFPELDGLEPVRQPNGELKIEIDLDERFPGRATSHARPSAVVLLERGVGGGQGLTRVAADDAPLEHLWPWGDHWTEAHQRAAELLSDIPRYRLVMKGTPDEAIDEIEALLADLTAPARVR